MSQLFPMEEALISSLFSDETDLFRTPAEPEVGDTVRTSGISAVYPPDIPIGVTIGSRLIDGSVNVVDVKLFVDFSSLRYVIIAENPDRQIIEKMEE